ncbi:hypothetical protein [uncultured Umboniibacter sp.]|uniref:hypothetical protein n=1 Tax=uncultured Umboniibacter sp. TaxID=1798917 RepID=UPI0026392DF3|nr:hypothetical protein [uncultured Umboniibacter sp.]
MQKIIWWGRKYSLAARLIVMAMLLSSYWAFEYYEGRTRMDNVDGKIIAGMRNNVNYVLRPALASLLERGDVESVELVLSSLVGHPAVDGVWMTINGGGGSAFAAVEDEVKQSSELHVFDIRTDAGNLLGRLSLSFNQDEALTGIDDGKVSIAYVLLWVSVIVGIWILMTIVHGIAMISRDLKRFKGGDLETKESLRFGADDEFARMYVAMRKILRERIESVGRILNETLEASSVVSDENVSLKQLNEETTLLLSEIRQLASSDAISLEQIKSKHRKGAENFGVRLNHLRQNISIAQVYVNKIIASDEAGELSRNESLKFITASIVEADIMIADIESFLGGTVSGDRLSLLRSRFSVGEVFNDVRSDADLGERIASIEVDNESTNLVIEQFKEGLVDCVGSLVRVMSSLRPCEINVSSSRQNNEEVGVVINVIGELSPYDVDFISKVMSRSPSALVGGTTVSEHFERAINLEQQFNFNVGISKSNSGEHMWISTLQLRTEIADTEKLVDEVENILYLRAYIGEEGGARDEDSLDEMFKLVTNRQTSNVEFLRDVTELRGWMTQFKCNVVMFEDETLLQKILEVGRQQSYYVDVVLVRNNLTKGTQSSALALGANDVIVSPVDVESLESLLYRVRARIRSEEKRATGIPLLSVVE